MHRRVSVRLAQIPAGNNPLPFQATRLGRTSRPGLALGGTEDVFGEIYHLLATIDGVGETLSDGLVNL